MSMHMTQLKKSFRNNQKGKILPYNKRIKITISFNLRIQQLPENVRNDLLVKLADNKEADKAVAKILKQYFDKLPNIIRNELTRKLEKKNS